MDDHVIIRQFAVMIAFITTFNMSYFGIRISNNLTLIVIFAGLSAPLGTCPCEACYARKSTDEKS